MQTYYQYCWFVWDDGSNHLESASVDSHARLQSQVRQARQPSYTVESPAKNARHRTQGDTADWHYSLDRFQPQVALVIVQIRHETEGNNSLSTPTTRRVSDTDITLTIMFSDRRNYARQSSDEKTS